MVWLCLIALIVILLMLDLLVLSKRSDKTNQKSVAIETAFWVSIALLFSGVVYLLYSYQLVKNINNLSPSEAFVKYLTGYLIELSLSMDNLFVIAMIFASFKIPIQSQHKALFWGILGALAFRGLMIWLGVTLINQLSWITYVFGGFLLYTAIKMLSTDEETEDKKYIKTVRKYFNVSEELDGDKFWTKHNGVRMATPLFAALVMIEFTDLIFAVDSVPAVLAVTTDPFIVFTSNIFAILGLRSMYFFLANMLDKFVYLKYSVFAILLFVSVKLLTLSFIHIPEWFSLLYIGLCLGTGVFISYRHLKNNTIQKP
jgi:tellurite resistance protein TerC